MSTPSVRQWFCPLLLTSLLVTGAMAQPDVSWTFGDVGISSYRLNAFSPDDLDFPAIGSQDPTIPLVVGQRIEITIINEQVHPIEILAKGNSAPQDIVLLSMAATGSFESDSDVNWIEHGQGRVSFTLTPELHTAMQQGGRIPGYRCRPHQFTMRGNFTVTEPEPGPVEGAPIVEPIDPSPLAVDVEPIATGLTAPVGMVVDPVDPNVFYIVDQSGVIHILSDGVLLDEVLLDISDRLVPLGFFGTMDVNDFDERGLLGLDFHPGFDDVNSPGYRRLYTYSSQPIDGEADFTVELPDDEEMNHQAVITEWQALTWGGFFIADPCSGREVLRIDEPQFNHDGGHIEFGPDGYLYIALGDGGSANDDAPGHGPNGNGQNIHTILGSIVRIDPLDPAFTPDSNDPNSANGAYRIPADNPFVGTDGVDEIFAYGLRNPYKFSFDHNTGDLIVADVGQGLVEEINIVTNGGNYGWRLKEGSFLFDPNGELIGEPLDDPNLIDPVAEYDHDEGLSVIGGYTYFGTAIPGLDCQYVFGDFSRSFSPADGRLFTADLKTGLIQELVLGPERRSLGLYVKGMGQDADGEVYVLASTALGPYGDTGQVLKIVPQSDRYAAELDGRSAGNRSSATGQARLRLSADGTRIDFTLSVTGLADTTMAHIHVSADPGGDGPPAVWLFPDTDQPGLQAGSFTGVLSRGSITADDLIGPLAGQTLLDLIQAMQENRAYVNVHTEQFPGGEIRGQLVEMPAPASSMSAKLNGTKGGNDSTATGTTLLQPNADGTEITYQLSVVDLADITAAHIHVAANPGEDGPPAVWLFDGMLDGSFTGLLSDGVMTDSDLIGPLAGQTLDDLLQAVAENRAYVNVHTQQFPGGEIRGQLH